VPTTPDFWPDLALRAARWPLQWLNAFSFDGSAANVLEPISVLNKGSLGKVGIKVTLDRVPGADQPSARLATQERISGYTSTGSRQMHW
jgi:hypothetical protein